MVQGNTHEWKHWLWVPESKWSPFDIHAFNTTDIPSVEVSDSPSSSSPFDIPQAPFPQTKWSRETHMNENTDYGFQRANELILASTTQLFRLKKIIKLDFEYAKMFENEVQMVIDSREDRKEAMNIMSFGLKNGGATYQRLVGKVFSHQIGRNLEAYVDDMVIKSTSEKEMLKDIQETFERFCSINMKLNLKKCSFGVEEGPFLGHLITKQGIKANPSKVKAVTDLDQPRTLKDIQSLNGKLAALSRIAKWAIELGEHDIVFLRRNEKETSSDFLAEIPFEDNEKKEKPKELPDSNSKWRLYTNGASNSDELGAWLMLIDPEGLRIAQEMEISKVAIFLDSQLLVNQIKETFAAKQTSIKDYLQKVKTALRGFEEYTVEHVRRNQNKKADALSNLASMTFKHLTKEVLVEVLTKMSIEEKEVLKVDMQERKSWMDPIYEYLLSGLLLEDTKEARFGVPRIISLKEEKHFKEGMFADLCKGLKVTQSFSPVTEHMEIMHHIERQLTRSQQGWVDNLAKTLWIHRTLPRNSQKETPFSLTYGSEAMIPIIETTNDRGKV
ncbi:reverse transcriptase domain-containing protein [Tanacetum coccineum]